MRRLAFRTRLLLGFLLVVAIVATVATLAGYSFLSHTVVKEAKARVELDLGAAWSAYEGEKNQLQIVLSLASQNDTLRDALRTSVAGPSLASQLDSIRGRSEIDFITLVDHAGRVMARGLPPYRAGDSALPNAVLEAALAGHATSGTVVLVPEALHREGDSLAERAYIPLVYTERALPSERQVEERGLVLLAAIPVLDSSERVLGALYGGVLLNRKFTLVDRIRNAAFGSLAYQGKPVGTVTLFLGDVRVATNVMLDAGTRALGTRVSRTVAETVLVRGERFADRAFVVNDWYLSAYDPIRDPSGRVIGIIYVGLLEKKYLGYRAGLTLRYFGVTTAALLLAAAVAMYLSAGFRRPITRLVAATRELSAGNLGARVAVKRGSREVAELSQAFNSMAQALEARSQALEQTSQALSGALAEAEEKNRAYLEMLGFVAHELKSPLASIVFALGSLRDRILGPVNDSQAALLRSAADSADYLRDTIANYLSLSRIEEGGLRLQVEEVAFRPDILDPLLARMSELAAERGMRLACDVDEQLRGPCDRNLITSVFANLLSNAVKYGRSGSEIRVAGRQEADGQWLRFSVWNEGPGFSREEGDKLFHKFSRLAGGGVDTKSGTGLGLFVALQIIEMHGGKVWATSEPGQWAEFAFLLPRRPGQEPGRQSQAS